MFNEFNVAFKVIDFFVQSFIAGEIYCYKLLFFYIVKGKIMHFFTVLYSLIHMYTLVKKQIN